MKIKLLKYTLALILLISIAHFAARYWVELEDYCIARAQEFQRAYVMAEAHALGLEPALQNNKALQISVDDHIERESLRHMMNPALIRAVIKRESGFNSCIVSPAGAIGLMQVMPSNAAFCSLKPNDLFDPYKNITCGCKVLANSLAKYNWDIVKALMYYNGGNVCFGNRQNNPCKETKEYPRHVLMNLVSDIRAQ